MVTIEEIQAAYYMVAATGVLVAAAFYILNIRETMRNRRGTFSSNVRAFSCSEAWVKAYLEASKMQWADYEDFEKKYGWEVNTELATKRYVVLARYDLMGRQYRTGLIDLDDIGAFNGFNLVWTWLKFKPIIEESRRRGLPKNAYSDLEYAAESILKKLSEDDPDLMRKTRESYPELMITNLIPHSI
jgi:hypothetical protein